MSDRKCEDRIGQVLEAARLPGGPSKELRNHLMLCGRCSELWEAERLLSGELGKLRGAAAPLRSSAASRQMLLATFDRRHPPARRWRPVSAWGLGLALAACLAMAVGIGFRQKQAPLDLTATWETSSDASALSSEEFTPVPYALPLATGELVRVVHTSLYPEALSHLGIDVDPGTSANFQADLVLGQDGQPRAVRLTE